MSVLSQPHFHDEEAAFSFLQDALWPGGPVCPHCGVIGNATKIKANPEKRVRYGLHKCRDCGKQFTVKVGTVFEHARIPLHKMLQAVHLICSSKKGISSHQLHRILEVQYKTAWFLSHRIREAMRDGSLAPMGGEGKVVEADETYFGEERFPDDRFSDGALRSYLVRIGFVESAVGPVVRAYTETRRYLGQDNVRESGGTPDPADRESDGEDGTRRRDPSKADDPPPLPPKKRETELMAEERILKTGLLAKEAGYRLIVNVRIGVKEIDRLIKALELDKEILADADAPAESEPQAGEAAH